MNKYDIKTRLIFSVGFFGEIINTSIFLGLVYLLKIRFSMNAQHIGVLMSMNSISYLICCIVFLKVSENMAPRHCIEFSFLIQALTVMGLIFVKTPGPVYILQILYGGSRAFMWPPLSGWLNRGKEGKDLSRTNSVFNLSWSLGGGLGPTFAGFFIGAGLLVPFIAGTVVYFIILASICFVSLTHPEIKAEKSEKENIIVNNLKDNSSTLRYYSWTGLFIVYIASQIIMTIYPIHALDNLGLSPAQSGVLLSVKGISATIFFIILGKTTFWQNKKSWILGSQAVLAFMCLCSTKINSLFLTGVFFALIGMMFALMYEMSLFNGMNGAINKTRRMTIHEVILTLGIVIGNIAGGRIYRISDYNSNMLWLSRLTILILAVELIISLKNKKTKNGL